MVVDGGWDWIAACLSWKVKESDTFNLQAGYTDWLGRIFSK